MTRPSCNLAGLTPLLALGVALLVLLPGLGAAPLDDPGEGQHAEIAREVRLGDPATLRLNGVRYFDKPPLLYWLTAGAFRLAGRNEWAARLAPAAGAALAVAGTALLGARLLGPGWGLAAAGALLSSALFLAFGRYLRPETLFVAAIQWGMTGLILGSLDPGAPGARPSAPGSPGPRSGDSRSAGPGGGDARPADPVAAASRAGANSSADARASRAAGRWRLLGCAALGVAALVKDPLGLLGPLAVVGLALALAGRARPLSAWLPRAGVGLLAAIGLGWYALAALRHPGFLWYVAVDNHLLNALRLRQFPDEDVPLTALEFSAVSLLGALPWILPAALAVAALIRRRAWRDPTETPWVALALWLLAVLAAGVLLPFRLPHYALPAYPAIALLAARAWHERQGRARGLIAAHVALFAVLAVGGAAIALGDGARFSEAVFSATDVYTRKESVRGEAGPLPAWALLRPLVAASALTFGATAAALALVFRRGSARLGLAVAVAGMLALAPWVEQALALVSAGRAVAVLAAAVRAQMGPEDLLVHEGPIENSGALEFYSGRRPVLLDGRRSVLGVGATFPDARDAFWDREGFERAWLSPRRVLLVSPRAPDRSAVAALPPERVRLLLEHNGRRLYDNQVPAR